MKAGGTHNVDSVPYEMKIDPKGKDTQARAQLRCKFSHELPGRVFDLSWTCLQSELDNFLVAQARDFEMMRGLLPKMAMEQFVSFTAFTKNLKRVMTKMPYRRLLRVLRCSMCLDVPKLEASLPLATVRGLIGTRTRASHLDGPGTGLRM